MRIAYLGPAGTFTEDALREAAGGGRFEAVRTATVPDAILAVELGEAERALVPFENSIEGSVRSTLDPLPFEAKGVTIVGEHDFTVRAHLIARGPLELGRIEAVLSHPQPLAPCATFLREWLPEGGRRGGDARRPRRGARAGGGGGGAGAGGGVGRASASRALRLHDPARRDRG